MAAGRLELNVMEPVTARHLLKGSPWRGERPGFADRCIDRIEWDVEVGQTHLEGALMPRRTAAS